MTSRCGSGTTSTNLRPVHVLRRDEPSVDAHEDPARARGDAALDPAEGDLAGRRRDDRRRRERGGAH